MLRLIVRIFLSALAFIYVLPMIQGISFHGNFMAAVGISIIFAVMLTVVELLALAISAVLTVSTLGLALLWLIPLWILGFWVLPAVALMLVADFMPTYLTVSGWIPAILAGLVMMSVGMATSKEVWQESARSRTA